MDEKKPEPTSDEKAERRAAIEALVNAARKQAEENKGKPPTKSNAPPMI